MGANVAQTIPKDQYKSIVIKDNLRITGFKSRVYDYSKDINKPKRDLNHPNLTFVNGDFRLDIRGRKELQKLKRVIDFALETKKEKK